MQGTSKNFFFCSYQQELPQLSLTVSPFRLSWWISQVADAICYSHSLLCTRAATLGYLLYYMYRYMLQFYTLAQSQKCF